MSQAAELLGARSASDVRLVTIVSAAHFVSHFYMIVLPALFIFVQADLGVSYIELGLAFSAFGIASALLQTPAGFLVDRLGARTILIGGLLLSSVAFATIGLTGSYPMLIAMYALAGAADSAYHPANYSLLSHHIPAARIGKAFSFHTFAAMLGAAVAPASLLMMQNLWGWRGAFLGASTLGVAVALVFIFQREDTFAGVAVEPERSARTAPAGWRLLLSAPIVLSLAFFATLAFITGGMQSYFVVAVTALHGTPVAGANVALSGYLLLSAIGVLAGGVIASRTSRHILVAVLGLATVALTAGIVAKIELGTVALVLVMAVGGFFYGVVAPSRDLIVRELTPSGSFGKVFGFVSTGFNIANIVAPLIYGTLMDRGSPQLVFVTVTVAAFAAIATVAACRPRRA